MTQTLTKEQAEDLIRGYYESLNPETLYLPPDSRWRHYRFQTLYGMVKIKNRINNKEDLKKALVKHAPLNAYYTIAKFLNPTILNKRSSETIKLHENIFLGSAFLIDIDHPWNESLVNLKNAHDFLKNKGFKEIEIHFTGKGGHVIAYDFYKETKIADPRLREADCLEKMKLLTKELEEQDPLFKADYPISRDTRRIKKLPGTITKHWTIAEKVDFEQLESFKPLKIGDYDIERLKDLKELLIEVEQLA